MFLQREDFVSRLFFSTQAD